MKNRIVSLLLALALLCALLPQTALLAHAEVYSGECGENLTWTLDTDTGELVISGSGSMYNGYYSYDYGWGEYKGQIKSVVLQNGVASIGYSAFANCSSLTDAIIPDSVTSIGNDAFENCSSLKNVTIGSGVKSIGSYAFHMCNSLLRVNISDTAAWCQIQFEGYSSNPLGYAHHLFLNGTRLTSFVFPEGMTKIPDFVLSGGMDITSVTIPDGVTSIGEHAFSDCEQLKSIFLPESVTSIGDYAFRYCKALTQLRLPDGVTSIGEDAFYGCAIQNLTIPDSVTSIGEGAFGSNSLTRITVGSGITVLPNYLFSPAWNLRTISLPAGLEAIRSNALGGLRENAHVLFAGSKEAWKNILIETENGALNDGSCFIHYNATDFDSHVKVVAYHPAQDSWERPKTDFSCPCGYRWTVEGDVPEMPILSYRDVAAGAFYYDAVAWALDNGITNGTSATTFSPNATCTRGQVVTFLWRAKGEPASASSENPFTDVKKGAYYYDAVLWAAENGITSGLSSNFFGPNSSCTRGQVVTFLWRAEGEPDPGTSSNPFRDVKKSDYFYSAVLWAAKNGITQGTGANTFSPSRTCTRGQIVTFLYRDLAA